MRLYTHLPMFLQATCLKHLRKGSPSLLQSLQGRNQTGQKKDSSTANLAERVPGLLAGPRGLFLLPPFPPPSPPPLMLHRILHSGLMGSRSPGFLPPRSAWDRPAFPFLAPAPGQTGWAIQEFPHAVGKPMVRVKTLKQEPARLRYELSYASHPLEKAVGPWTDGPQPRFLPQTLSPETFDSLTGVAPGI